MTPAEHQTEFMTSLEKAILDAGGVPARFTRPDTTLADLCSLLAQNGIRFVHEKPPQQTPAEEAGWKVGDVGKIRSNGRLVTLHEDDGSEAPFWRYLDAREMIVKHLHKVDRLVPTSECE